MLLSASFFLICLVALLTFWQPQGLFSASATCVVAGSLLLLAHWSTRPWSHFLTGALGLIILLMAFSGFFTLFLTIGAPKLVVRKRERLGGWLVAGIWVWLALCGGWFFAVTHGQFSETLWPWVTFIPLFSTYFAILYGASLIGLLRTTLFHARHADTLVVLGAGLLRGDQIGRILAARLDTALQVARRQPHPVTIIVSGGQGPDETMSEAAAMAAYLMAHNFPSDQLIQEDQSQNTRANLINSQRLWGQLPQQGRRVAIVTNSYHLFRARNLASSLHIRVSGIPAPTRWSYFPVAWAREFLAIIVMHPNLHRGVLIGLVTANLLWLLI
ncbi:YdcF family protein [Levilactobacillus fujinensis]|uniref:YdcF family protein n=1 Tax=Levilactobacillus fujinensis TaxID=2486024 RepID=A0ABW1TIK9_9LACO|nr:YdcF family protein [Levilactobacillus fujinensis]